MSAVLTAIRSSCRTTAGKQQAEKLEKKVESVAKISFQTRGLTCVSQMEQDGARREAEAGDVGAELDPLQRREGNKTQCDFSSSARGQKSQKNCLPPNAQ